MFRDYAERGRAFKDEVDRLGIGVEGHGKVGVAANRLKAIGDRDGHGIGNGIGIGNACSTGAFNSHQIGCGGKELAAGNTGRPGL